MSIFYMDSHMHFDLYGDKGSIIDYIESKGSYTLAVTNLPVLFKRYYNDFKNYKYIKLALGFHPELVFEYQDQLPIFLSHINKTRYIGEVGLDFSTENVINRESQLMIFSEIIKRCNEHKNKIVSVHSRRAHKEVIEILTGFNGMVILHWYSGSIRELKTAISREYYFSINQQMIRSNTGRKIINMIPLDRILIESDAPFTCGLKDKYDLFFVDEIYKYLSETRNIQLGEVSRVIYRNFKKIFS